MKKEPTYLGDGLYATDDGFMIELFADQPEGRQRVWLEPQVAMQFIRYFERLHGLKITVIEKNKESSHG